MSYGYNKTGLEKAWSRTFVVANKLIVNKSGNKVVVNKSWSVCLFVQQPILRRHHLLADYSNGVFCWKVSSIWYYASEKRCVWMSSGWFQLSLGFYNYYWMRCLLKKLKFLDMSCFLIIKWGKYLNICELENRQIQVTITSPWMMLTVVTLTSVSLSDSCCTTNGGTSLEDAISGNHVLD